MALEISRWLRGDESGKAGSDAGVTIWIGFAVCSSAATFAMGWLSGWCFRQLFIMAAPITPHVPMMAMIIGSLTVLGWSWKQMICSSDQSARVKGPNDPKLSDCGARRAGCGKAAGAGWAQAAGWWAAASVTRGAVRCSAWLGVAVNCEFMVQMGTKPSPTMCL